MHDGHELIVLAWEVGKNLCRYQYKHLLHNKLCVELRTTAASTAADARCAGGDPAAACSQ